MNPSAYGQQYPPQGWPQSQPQQQPPMSGPPTSMPLSQSQAMLNGNYQQQLVNSVSGMSINPSKSIPNAPPSSTGNSMPPPPMGNGPQGNENSLGSNNNMMPNNNSVGLMGYPNGPTPPSQQSVAGMPPMKQGPQPLPQVGQQQPAGFMQQSMGLQQASQQRDGPQPGENLFPPANQQGHQQMTVKNADLPGMPHMPPPKTQSPFMPPQAGGEPPKPQESQPQKPQVGGQFPPQPQQQQPTQPQLQQPQMPQKYPTPSMTPTSQPGPMYPPQQNPMQQPSQQQQPMQFGQMPPRPGQQMPPQPGQMQMPGQPTPPQGGPMHPQGGPMPPQGGPMPPQGGPMPPQGGPMPPRPGQQMPLQPGQMQMPGQQPMHGQSSMSGLPPMPGQPPMAGRPSMPGQPPMPGQLPMPGQPPMPGQSQMTGQPMSSLSGPMQMPPRSGQQMPPQPGQMPMPPQPGSLPPQPGQLHMPPQMGQMQMPPMPGQMPPQPGQMPPMQGQMPFQQGGGPMQYQTGPMAPPPTGQMPGYPPQPGQQMGYSQPPGMYNQQYQQQAAAPRRLDPDQMPNPIQVMIENQRNAGGPFVTNQAGLLPPLVTTKFIVQDQGNSSPRFVRSSLYCVPSTSDLLKTTALPFSLVISPFAKTVEGEYDAPIVDFGELGPIRCNRCKAYMSPNMQFIDAGRRFQCLMCKVSTEVPTEYFQHLDHTGQRVDKYERPELVLGTYEFVATKDYCRNNIPPEIPAYVFIIDVSYNNVKSGLVHLLCQEIKRIIKHFPIDQGQEKSKMRVGFITYNSTVHFYNIKSTLAQPQMMVVGDVNDMFMPLLDGFLVDPEESEAVIEALMEQIPKMFLDTKETETILLPAIQAGLEALKASNCAGKLLVFNSSLPICEAPGKLRNRDDRKLLGTDKEKTILTPQTTAYNQLGQDCVQAGCSVDLFVFNNSYVDIATVGQVSRLTGGEVYKYTYFQAELDGNRLIEDIIKNVSRPIAFDAVMRVRTSAGIRATEFYGHYFMSNTTDVELASIDSNKAIAIEIKHDDKLPPEENIYLQVALLYTSSGGQRRLRILNLALRVTTTIADVFKSCDLDAIILFFAKQSMFKLMELTPKVVKDNLIHRSAQTLACYRKHCTSPTSAGQLILPECLKLLPLYVSCLIKNDAISGGSDMTVDDRSYVIQFVLSMDLQMSVTFFYPRLIPIHNVEPDDTELPPPIRVTHEKMSEDGAYILENGVYLFFWLGMALPQSFIQPLFNVQCTQQVNSERFAIVGDTPLAKRVRQIIDTIMHERTRYMRVTCVRQNDKLESVFRHFLIEDRGTDGSASYVDFLCHMHKEIKDLLS